MISFIRIDDQRINAATLRSYGPNGETSISVTPLQGKALTLSFPNTEKRDEVLSTIDGAVQKIQEGSIPQVYSDDSHTPKNGTIGYKPSE